MLGPRALLGLTSLDEPTGAAVFLIGTKRIRDLAIGVGTVTASLSESDDDRRRWILTALGSDSLDAVATFLSQWPVGRSEALRCTGPRLLFPVSIDGRSARSIRYRRS